MLRTILILALMEIILAACSLGEQDFSADYWLDIGNSYSQNGSFDEAVKSYDNALQMNPKYPEAWYNRGLTLYYKGMRSKGLGNPYMDIYDEALRSYDAALKLNPDYALCWFSRGVLLSDIGNYNNAVESFDSALENIPEGDRFRAYTLNYRGRALYLQNKDLDALQSYEDAIWIDGNLTYVWYNRGLALTDLGKYDEAVSSYDRAIDLYGDYAYAYNNRGTVQFILGNYNSAIYDFRQASKLDPNITEAYYNTGLALQKLAMEENNNGTRYEEAIEYYNIAIAKNHSYLQAWNNKGLALQSLNRTAEANEAFVKVRAIKIRNEWKSIIFASFLSVYLLMILSAYRRARKIKASACSMILLANMLGFFTFGCILAGYFSFKILLLFYVIGFSLLIFLFLSWAILGSLSFFWGSMTLRAFREFEKNHSRISKISIITVLMALASYPFLAAIGYFRYATLAELDALHMLNGSMAIVFIVGLAATLPILTGVLTSPNLDKDTRNILLLLQSCYLGINAVFLSLILWNLEISIDNRFNLIVIAMMSIFALIFLLPYLSGWQRARRWKEELLSREIEWLNDLLNVLEFPTPHLYAFKLEQILSKIKSESENFSFDQGLRDPLFNSPDEKIKAQHKRLDHRLKYMDFLTGLQVLIVESIDQFKAIAEKDASNAIDISQGYTNAYNARRGKLISALEEERKAKPMLWIILASIMSTLLGKALGDLGSLIGLAFTYAGDFSTVLAQISVIK